MPMLEGKGENYCLYTIYPKNYLNFLYREFTYEFGQYFLGRQYILDKTIRHELQW